MILSQVSVGFHCSPSFSCKSGLLFLFKFFYLLTLETEREEKHLLFYLFMHSLVDSF